MTILISPQIIKSEKEIVTGNIYSDITDHLPNFIIIKSNTNYEKSDRPLVRIYGEKNMDKFKNLIANSDWEEFYSTKDESKAIDLFYKIYNKAFDKAFPLKRLSRKRSKDKKWITTELKSRIQLKDKLYKTYILNPTTENKIIHSNYKNNLTRELRTAEETYYKDLICSENKNLHKLWSIFGNIINPQKSKKKNNIDKLIHNNKIETDDNDIANAFNEHFCTIGEKLANKFNNDNNYKKYLKNENVHTFFLYPTNEQETLEEINKLNPKKSGGSDNMSPKLLKECNNLFSKPISHIINLSFENSKVPDKLKIAKVIPLFKKNDKHNPDNYRPISTLNKIMEKLMHKRLIGQKQGEVSM